MCRIRLAVGTRRTCHPHSIQSENRLPQPRRNSIPFFWFNGESGNRSADPVCALISQRAVSVDDARPEFTLPQVIGWAFNINVCPVCQRCGCHGLGCGLGAGLRFESTRAALNDCPFCVHFSVLKDDSVFQNFAYAPGHVQRGAWFSRQHNGGQQEGDQDSFHAEHSTPADIPRQAPIGRTD